MQPLADRVIVRPTQEDPVRASGLVVVNPEKPQRGIVLAVGTGTLTKKGARHTPEVSEGDDVLYGKYAGTEIEVDGEDLMVLREADIIARIEP